MIVHFMERPEQVSSREIRAALIITGAILASALVLQVATGEAVRYDFSANYIAGWMMRYGDPSQLYDLAAQARAQQLVFHRSFVFPTVHTAFEALFFAPLAGLSYGTAYLLWGAVNIFLWLWFAIRMRPFTAIGKQPFRYLILCFSFYPVWIGFLHGGTSLALLAVYSAVFIQMKRGRDFLAGAFLGVGLFRYHLVLPFIVVCAIRQKWKFLAGFSVVALALAVTSVAAVGIAGTTAYVRLLMGMMTNARDPINSMSPPPVMTTLRAFLVVLLEGKIPILWINGAVAVVSAGLIGWVGLRWRRDDERGGANQDLLFAATLGVCLIVAVYSLIHDFGLILLAILLAADAVPVRNSVRLRRQLSGCVLVMYALPVVSLLTNRGHSFFLLSLAALAFVWIVAGMAGVTRAAAPNEI